jgi:hypothetical protein
MKTHLTKERVGDVIRSMPKLEEVRFEANKVFQVGGRVFLHPFIVYVGKWAGNHWACPDGNVIQEPSGALYGKSVYWTSAIGDGYDPPRPAPFNASAALEAGIVTPMSPEVLSLVQFYIVRQAEYTNQEKMKIDFPVLDDLVTALRQIRGANMSTVIPVRQRGANHRQRLSLSGPILQEADRAETTVPAPAWRLTRSRSLTPECEPTRNLRSGRHETDSPSPRDCRPPRESVAGKASGSGSIQGSGDSLQAQGRTLHEVDRPAPEVPNMVPLHGDTLALPGGSRQAFSLAERFPNSDSAEVPDDSQAIPSPTDPNDVPGDLHDNAGEEGESVGANGI